MKHTYIFLLLAFTTFLKGNSYYVSPTGDDMSKGNKWFLPFKTLQKAANVTRPGDTVFIMKGDYASTAESLLKIENSGKENAWIVYMNYLNHKPVLKIQSKYGIFIKANYISIEGLNIGGSNEIISPAFPSLNYGVYIDGSFDNPCTHIKIYNNFIHNVKGPGVQANYFDYLTLSFNKFFSNAVISGSKAGIFLKNAVDIDARAIYHNFIQGNVLQKNGFPKDSMNNECMVAILFEYDLKYLPSPNSKTLIHNNIIYVNAGGGIQLNSVLGFDVVNNTMYKNAEKTICQNGEIEIINSTGVNVYNNIFYSSASKAASTIKHAANVNFKHNLYYNFSSKENGFNDLIANPAFEMTNDKEELFNFRLKGNSPAINAGIDQLLSDIDFEGNIRKMDTHVDLGALEFTNRILPSLKHTKAGPQHKGMQSFWTSLYTKDQKVYTIWNQQNKGFSLRLFDSQGKMLLEKLADENSDSSFEIDFNNYSPGFYTVLAFNSYSRHLERIQVQTRTFNQ